MPAADRPVVIYDGNCGFCKLWIDHWKRLTGDAVEYSASTDAGESVQLHLPDGEVLRGARAVFTTLKYAPGYGWLEKAYYSIPGFAAVSELAYRVIAAHRPAAYRAVVLLFGKPVRPPEYDQVSWTFQKLLALIYIIAFWSFAVQARGLIGSRGILPLSHYLDAFRATFGSSATWMAPTVWWFNSSDAAIVAVPLIGIAAACVVLSGFVTRIGLIAAFVLYLSICSGGQDFYSFQWDLLLLEAGFLAIFLGSRTTVWLYRWLLFRLMFSSGVVKLASGDPTWRNLTALSYHYHTQPLPSPLAWYADKLPLAVQKASTATTFFIELLVPVFMFLPRRARHFAGWCTIALQFLIALTGNYAFFNILTIAMCLFLFDDAALQRILPRRIAGRRLGSVRTPVLIAVAVLVTVLGIAQLTGSLLNYMPRAATALLRVTQPFGIVNSYGLFAVMTTTRPEIIVQGSIDGQNWTDYHFRYKPVELTRAPMWVAPHQPRLDWQMWFAALGSYQNNPWFVNFLVRLLQGSPEVLNLLENTAATAVKPRYVRALLFDYSFSDFATRSKTGRWWERQPRGMYLPPISLEDVRETGALQNEKAAFDVVAVNAVPDYARFPRCAVVPEAHHLAGVQVAAAMSGPKAPSADVQQLPRYIQFERLGNVQGDNASGRKPWLRPSVVLFQFRMHSFAAHPP